MFLRFFIAHIIFLNFFLNIQADEKQSIINHLSEIDNFSFDFAQITEKKKETGSCLLAFNNQLRCNYDDELQKEIIVNNKTLVVLQKRYNKIYFYPIKETPFINILDKAKLINLVQESSLILNDDIELIYLDKNGKKITVFFNKKNYNLNGWLIEDDFQNVIYFSLKIKKINIDIEKNYFKIPSLN